MAPNTPADHSNKVERERSRVFRARKELHEKAIARRRRDNVLAGIAAAVILVAAIIVQIVIAPPAGNTPEATPSASPSATSTPEGSNTGDVPSKDIAEGREWTGTMNINGVEMNLTLDGAKAPQAVSSFIDLTKKGFYNGLTCHRLVDSEGFKVLQCGDPDGTGAGGPGYSYGPVENAPSDNQYAEGTLAMARQSENGYSNGSQFFIVFGDTTIGSDTAGGYSVLGKITSGIDTLIKDVTSKGVSPAGSQTPAEKVTIESITVK